jgi:hypothetical protein
MPVEKLDILLRQSKNFALAYFAEKLEKNIFNNFEKISPQTGNFPPIKINLTTWSKNLAVFARMEIRRWDFDQIGFREISTKFIPN